MTLIVVNNLTITLSQNWRLQKLARP